MTSEKAAAPALRETAVPEAAEVREETPKGAGASRQTSATTELVIGAIRPPFRNASDALSLERAAMNATSLRMKRLIMMRLPRATARRHLPRAFRRQMRRLAA